MAKESVLRMSPDLMEDVLSGEKNVTIRYGTREFEKDITIEGHAAEVMEYRHYKLIDVPLEYLMIDGFETFGDALRCLKKFYPTITPESDVTVVEFELKVFQ